MASKKTPLKNKNRVDFMKVETLALMTPARRQQLLLRSVTKMEQVRPLIREIMEDVQQGGDTALLRFTKQFDNVELPPASIRVSKSEIRKAYLKIQTEQPELIPTIIEAQGCIRDFHENEVRQLRYGIKRWSKGVNQKSWGIDKYMNLGQLTTPIERVGIYVPGGNAVLFTTALMGVTPAKVAGVREIIVASPPSRNGDIDPRIIVAADLAGATMIVRAGGAQAIAAMAYGTKSVPRVNKIFGPGNIFVAAAKSYASSSGICAIDFLAGPSEILVLADDSSIKGSRIDWIARDMISQAEHDSDACAILATNSKLVAQGVRDRIHEIINDKLAVPGPDCRLNEVAKSSLSKFGAILLVKDLEEAVSFANEFAPEHLEIVTRNPKNLALKVRNAGAIFLGPYSPVAIGDYIGPNHILPTGGAARYTSGINIDMFLKKPTVSRIPVELTSTLSEMVGILSKAEGLYNQHGLSVEARLGKRKISSRLRDRYPASTGL